MDLYFNVYADILRAVCTQQGLDMRYKNRWGKAVTLRTRLKDLDAQRGKAPPPTLAGSTLVEVGSQLKEAGEREDVPEEASPGPPSPGPEGMVVRAPPFPQLPRHDSSSQPGTKRVLISATGG